MDEALLLLIRLNTNMHTTELKDNKNEHPSYLCDTKQQSIRQGLFLTLIKCFSFLTNLKYVR